MRMHCSHCSLPLTKERGRFEVHDPHGLSGVFCTARCYEQVREIRENFAKLSPDDQAQYNSDLMLLGSAFIKVSADGSVAYVPPDQWNKLKPVKRAHGDADTLMQEEGIVR